MGKEIERKFLVIGDSWRKLAKGTAYRQGYLSTEKERIVRIRTIGEKGYITVKGISIGMIRSEFEYEIPMEDAKQILDELCEKPLIEKYRFKIPFDNMVWEVDEFFGENKGLIIAEIELISVDQSFSKPTWIGKEVTYEPKYFNANLIHNPFSKW